MRNRSDDADIEAIHASPYRRAMQTVVPLSRSRGLRLHIIEDLAGFRIFDQRREGEWSSAARREPAGIKREELEIEHGEDLAVALAVSQAIQVMATAPPSDRAVMDDPDWQRGAD